MHSSTDGAFGPLQAMRPPLVPVLLRHIPFLLFSDSSCQA